MTALVLDAGAFVGVERRDRVVRARLRAAQQQGLVLRTPAIVIAEVWRDPRGRQARLAQFLRGVDAVPVDGILARQAGTLLGRTGTRNPVDATVALVAEDGDSILTGDPGDLQRLVDAAGRNVAVLPC